MEHRNGAPCKGITFDDPALGSAAKTAGQSRRRRFLVVPLQGDGRLCNPLIPRALPWARLFRPLRGFPCWQFCGYGSPGSRLCGRDAPGYPTSAESFYANCGNGPQLEWPGLVYRRAEPARTRAFPSLAGGTQGGYCRGPGAENQRRINLRQRWCTTIAFLGFRFRLRYASARHAHARSG